MRNDMTSMHQNDFQELFERSRDEKKGLRVYFNGQSVPGLVASFDDRTIVLKNQEFDRIVVRVSSIDAVAIS